MSYKNKLQNYQGDCNVEIGKYSKFSDYIAEFAKTVNKHSLGLDIGAGPRGCNGVFFENYGILHGCDVDIDVVNTLPSTYSKKYVYALGKGDKLPYTDGELDYVICSCVIQHLHSFDELETGVREISRVLKCGGQFYLMFKAGTNDTTLTHFNSYYQEHRTFRVFHPNNVISLVKKYSLSCVKEEKLVDDNWIPYCNTVFRKE